MHYFESFRGKENLLAKEVFWTKLHDNASEEEYEHAQKAW